jgi:predicted acyltransferase
MTAPTPSAGRIASLDQYRGYAIFGMLLVNFFGHYDTKWVQELNDSGLKSALMFIFGQQLHHHSEYMTYADTIAPIFMFVVGIGMRLSWMNRANKVAPSVARKSMAKRYFTLVLIAFAIYTGWLWDALMNIGLAGLVALVIIDKKWSVRIAYALGLVIAFQLIFCYTSYGEWLLRMGKYGREMEWPLITALIPLRGDLLSVPINGGLIGHWSWAFMLIFGTIAYDIMATRNRQKILAGLIGFGLVLTIAGFGARAIGTQAYYKKAEPFAAKAMLAGDFETAGKIIGKSPGIFYASTAKYNEAGSAALESRNLQQFVEVMRPQLEELAAKAPETAPRLGNPWVFSKNYQTMPFTFWATALCLFHLLAFYIICDVLNFNVPGMAVVGMNPLFIYIFQSLTLEIYSNLNDHWNYEATTSGTLVLGSFVVYWGLIYGMARYFYEKNIVIKI